MFLYKVHLGNHSVLIVVLMGHLLMESNGGRAFSSKDPTGTVISFLLGSVHLAFNILVSVVW